MGDSLYYQAERTTNITQIHLSPELAVEAISAAYDILRGKSSGSAGHDPYREEVMRRKAFYQAHYRRRAEYARQHPNYAQSRREWTASADDRWKDRVILIVGVITLAAGLAPGFFMPHHLDKQHRSAVSNLRQARMEAREFGEERMGELRKRARNIKKQQEADTYTNSKDEI
ncbi:hypothetical protein DXG03_009337 [Asterophora parasitica]|uniref:J domain-containing protein n=1 Tax=Asterophora parasitica TaxID=117018 RepID=A0A9P7G4X2_9AGAR|nr:hypothetical protein DXG03_009337 [Asterophora parasitica]